MPPIVALIICAVLILVALRLDTAASAATSPALWIPTVWVLIMGSRMVSQWFAIGSSGQSLESYQDGSPLDRGLFVFLIAAALFILFKRRLRWSTVVRKNVWLSLFLCYCGASIVWSDFPLVALKRYVKDIGNIAMVLVVLTDSRPILALTRLGRRCAFILIPLSIVLYKYYPTVGRGYSVWTGDLFVTGVTNNKNSLGALALVCTLLLLWSVRQREAQARDTSVSGSVTVLILMMTLWTLVTANSATSLACTALGGLVLFAGPLLRTRKLFLTVCGVIAILAVAGAELWGGGAVNLVVNGLGRDTTLTGRTELWDDVLAMSSRPLIGAGFASFWLGDRMEVLWSKYWWHPTEAHNGYLEVYLDLGLIGLLLLCGMVTSAFYGAISGINRGSDIARLQLALLVVVVFYNFTEAGFRVDLLMYFMFLIAAIDTRHSYLRLKQADRPSLPTGTANLRRTALRGAAS